MDRLGLYEDLKKITKEISLELEKQKELQILLEQRIKETNRQNLDNALRYAIDIQQGKEEQQVKKIDTTLAKTAGSTLAINKNKAHEFARTKTMVHMKSDTVVTWIPKNACSNIRYSVALDNGAISGIQDISWIHSNNNTFNASNKELLQAKNSFVILRNPFKRLLSFYLDKICHIDESGNDSSYDDARKTFKTNETTTFEEFVDIIYKNPMLITKDIHTRHQCDFMIYKRYCNYYSVERLGEAIDSIYKKTGLELKDIRNENSIFTTMGKERTNIINHNTKAGHIRNFMNQNKTPISEIMYTKIMVGKVASLYLTDVMLYHRLAPNSYNELKDWMQKLLSLNN